MWEVRYGNHGEQGGKSFTLSQMSDGNDIDNSATYVIPLTDPNYRDFYDVKEEVGVDDNIDLVIVEDASVDNKSELYSWVNVDDTLRLPEVEPVPVSSSEKGIPWIPTLSESLKADSSKAINENHIGIEGKEYDWKLLYGSHRLIFMACFVRLLLIGHNILTVWRVTHAYNENMYWLLVTANFFLLFEGMVIAIRNGGKEFSWWCPCFLIYLSSTIPAIWLLQLNQYDLFINAGRPVDSTLDNEVWVIFIEESLVYLLVFSRWLLPRGKLLRDFLADLLIEFLAIASDIMELIALFDEDKIRGNLNLTYAIMAVWSASFIQFIPVLMQRKRFRKVRNPNVECLTRYFGDKFVEIVATCMSIFLQDLPFFVIRLYIIFELDLITYSLIFFSLKNAVTLLLLSYRLVITCYQIPPCKRKRGKKQSSD